jgi:long-chain acyl-CoA synthetase
MSRHSLESVAEWNEMAVSRPIPLTTIADVFWAIVGRAKPHVMMQREAIDWIAISSQELYSNVCGTAHALQDWGIVKGDRVAILSENRPEWSISDFASLLLGAVTVPVYSTLTDQQTAYILRDSGARVVFVSSDKQLAKVLAIRDQTAVEKIVVMDAVETAHAFHMERLMKEGPAERDFVIERLARALSPDDLATIIYTSGTTGTPKGAMLTHGNLAANIACSLQGFDIQPDDRMISFLPLSHVTARHVDFAMLYHGVTLAYCPAIDQLPRALQELRPTIFVAVPRVYEKIYNQVEQKTKSFPKSAIYRWALSVGRRHVDAILAGRTPSTLTWRLADRLVFSQVRAGVGGQVRVYISGGAPLGRELAGWYANIGIRIHEGYGLTETSPVIAVNTPRAHKLGTVGKPLSNLEVRIAEDGELLVRGPSVFPQYWNRPEETRAAFSEGWFKTGDIGQLDADGFLSITDRKKDLIKTSGGKFIAPQPIENSLKHNALIAEAVIVGDKRKFPAVLLVPYFSLLEDWARQNQIPFHSRAELVADARVQALFQGIVADLNQSLARFEKLKKIIVISDEFTAENGLLTASMKLRRRAVEERYRDQIEHLYSQADSEVTQAEQG